MKKELEKLFNKLKKLQETGNFSGETISYIIKKYYPNTEEELLTEILLQDLVIHKDLYVEISYIETYNLKQDIEHFTIPSAAITWLKSLGYYTKTMSKGNVEELL